MILALIVLPIISVGYHNIVLVRLTSEDTGTSIKISLMEQET